MEGSAACGCSSSFFFEAMCDPHRAEREMNYAKFAITCFSSLGCYSQDHRPVLTIQIDRRELLDPQSFKLCEIAGGVVSGLSRGFQQVQRFELESVTAEFVPVLLKFAIFVAA